MSNNSYCFMLTPFFMSKQRNTIHPFPVILCNWLFDFLWDSSRRFSYFYIIFVRFDLFISSCEPTTCLNEFYKWFLQMIQFIFPRDSLNFTRDSSICFVYFFYVLHLILCYFSAWLINFFHLLHIFLCYYLCS